MNHPFVMFFLVVSLSVAMSSSSAEAQQVQRPWKRHTIDQSGKGADGVRLMDVDGDAREDIVTGWEQSGHVCVYFQPRPVGLRKPWPRALVGRVPAVEDAVAVDLDSDGTPEVISCHEGAEKSVMVHRFVADRKHPVRTDLIRSGSWQSTAIESCQNKSRWMFAAPLLDRDRSVQAIVVASKEPSGQVSLLVPTGAISSETDNDASKTIENWRRNQLQKAGWVMSLVAIDMDVDGDQDIVVSDRKGPRRGVYWLENPGAERLVNGSAWKRHDVGGKDFEVMFLDAAPDRILVATRNRVTLDFEREHDGGWKQSSHNNPAGILGGKAVRWLDDSKQRFVFSSNTGVGKGDNKKSGVWIVSTDANVPPIDVSGIEGVKYDRIEVRDLDGDGDRDVITCEERDNLGVFWYENPEK